MSYLPGYLRVPTCLLVYRELCLLLSLLAASGPVFSQGIYFRQLGKQQGLSQNTVFDITQDDHGFMWFATRDGLNRYDGYSMKVFRSTGDTVNSILDNDVRLLNYDTSLNSLWLGTTRGLCRYDSRRDTFIQYPDFLTGPDKADIRFMDHDENGDFWVGTQNAIYLKSTGKDSFKRMFVFDGNKGKVNIRAWLEVDCCPGHFWVGTDLGIYYAVHQDDTLSMVPGEHKFQSLGRLASVRISALTNAPDDRLWIGTFDQGLYRWNQIDSLTSPHMVEDSYLLEEKRIEAIYSDAEGRTWVGTANGVRFKDSHSGDFQSILEHDSELLEPFGNPVKSIYVDAKGSLWVGTYFEGIYYLDRDWGEFGHYVPDPVANSISFKVVSSFAEQEDGRIWIGTEGGGLNLFDHVSGSFINYQRGSGDYHELSSNNIKSLLLQDDVLWVGTFQAGLDRIEISSKKITNFHAESGSQGLPHNSVYSLVDVGKFIWLGTFGGGLSKYDTESGLFQSFNHDPNDTSTISDDRVRKVLLDADSVLWVGTENGLNRLNLQNNRFTFERYLPDVRVLSIHSDGPVLWVGARSVGLIKLDKQTGETTRYSRNAGLPGETVFGILPDSDGTLWLSTDNGISQFDPNSLELINFNDGSGLENREFNVNAYITASNGHLFFGSKTGFTVFDPKKVEITQYVPPTIIRNFRTHSDGVDSVAVRIAFLDGKTITLPYDNAHFSIDFASLDYSNPLQNRYAYMLEGLERQWQYKKGDPSVTYNIQREGLYKFRLRGSNSHGLWNPEEKVLLIEVLPPLHRSGIAIALYILGLFSFLYAIIRFTRLRSRLKLEKALREQEEKLHEARLDFYSDVAHEFRTPLSLIINPLDRIIDHDLADERLRSALETVRRNAGRLLQMLDQIITFRKVESRHLKLQVEERDLNSFLVDICNSFRPTARNRNLNFQLIVPDEETRVWIDSEKLERVYYNLLSNAFKFTPDGGQIQMTVCTIDEHVNVTVADSGCGVPEDIRDQIFDKFYYRSEKGITGTKSYGIGLSLSRQMMDLHQGSISVEDSDLGGVAFVTSIQLGQKHFRPEQIKKLVVRDTPAHNLREWVNNSPSRDESLLIVDDDAEVLKYLEESLSPIYKVSTSSSGHEALALASEVKPDIVLCDFMMPGMDGVGLCQTLKTQIETSHIPIILLTARTAKQDRLAAFQSGADSYITKPFDLAELELRIANLLDNREKVRRRFARTESFEPKNVKISDADELFMEKAMQVVEHNIGNVQFNVEDFAREMAVSRPLLFTKIKALTGLTPNNFVKTVRLKRARQLLEQNNLSISEISFRVGFRDARYFRRCFKQFYDQTPSELQKD